MEDKNTIPAADQRLSYEGYTLRWEDDFNAPQLNRDDWNVELHQPGWVNHELQAYIDSPQTIYIENSTLVLKPVETKQSDGTISYVSGRVNTQHKHDFQYGIFEARIKVPAGKGFLPAFWMMPTEEERYGQWPRCGEIDIMEVLGHDTARTYGTIHYGNPHRQVPQLRRPVGARQDQLVSGWPAVFLGKPVVFLHRGPWTGTLPRPL